VFWQVLPPSASAASWRSAAPILRCERH